jgi:hypothetical protein
MALLSGAQQIFGSLLYRKDRMPAGSPLRRALFPQQGQLCAFRRSVNIVSFENQFRPARVQSTATQQWRRGPRWPAKMAPSLAAANIYSANHDARAALTGLECGACTDWTE